ncbi:MAG: hypothetical protein LBI48_12865 [Burkholderiaceae bacterium]|jgi:hypothetical protein|nr:hypothetical protein [Burkholderiaceae bacterium]
MKICQSTLVAIAAYALPVHNAFARIIEGNTVILKGYGESAIAAFIGIGIFSIILLAIIRAIKLALIVNFSIFAAASTLLGIITGLYAAFVMPAYKLLYENIGWYLPATGLAINLRYFLWVPLLLIIISWRPLRSNPARDKYYAVCFLCEAIMLFLVHWALLASMF